MSKELQANITTVLAVLAFGLAVWTAIVDRRRKLVIEIRWRSFHGNPGAVAKGLQLQVSNPRQKAITVIRGRLRFSSFDAAKKHDMYAEKSIVPLAIQTPLTLRDSESAHFELGWFESYGELEAIWLVDSKQKEWKVSKKAMKDFRAVDGKSENEWIA